MLEDLHSAIQQICDEKNLSVESVIGTIEAALAAAYNKDFGEKNQNIRATFDLVSGGMRVFDVKTVVEDMDLEELEKQRLELDAKREAGEEVDETLIKRFNPKKEIMLTEAKQLKPDAEIGEEIKQELIVPGDFGRMAAQTAKQVIIQRLREAERQTIFEDFKGKEGTIVDGTVQRFEGRLAFIDLGKTLAIMPQEEQIARERYNPGQRLKFFVVSVNLTARGPEIILSRAHEELLRQLFAFEVPEISNGTVEIKSVAREAGNRSKIVVSSNQENIDPIGSCVGQRGSRVQTIINELGGEKIDIIEWNEDASRFISNALSPAKVTGIEIDEVERIAHVQVKEDQLSLAIGKGGQNVRLAAKLTGWKIDIAGATEFLEAENVPTDIPAKSEEADVAEEVDLPAKVETKEAEEDTK